MEKDSEKELDEKSSLDDLKEIYLQIEKEQGLPSFEELNVDFYIERLADTETDYLVREIRKFMTEKFSSYLRFVEAILHPTNSSMFIFSVVKAIGTSDKEKIGKIYKELAKLELRHIELELGFSEDKEISFIKDSYKVWIKIKKDLLEIVEAVGKTWTVKTEVNNKNYFG